MANYREIKRKLAIQPLDAAMFRGLALLHGKRVVGPKRRKVFDVYFDIPELALNESAMMLRLRKVGGKWWQTLRAEEVAVGVPHQRTEWEYAQPVPQIDLALFRKTPLGKLAQRSQLHLTLKPAFSIAIIEDRPRFSQQSLLPIIRLHPLGRSSRYTANRPPAKRRFNLLLKPFASECEVAVGCVPDFIYLLGLHLRFE